MTCPFCTINQERNPVIKEKDFVIVIPSNPRLVPGHLLIIPKRHVERLSELNTKERKELFETTVEFQEKIIKTLSTGCDIRQNYRPFLKEDDIKVNHLHIHLLPRKFEDELYEKCQIFEIDIFKKLNNEEIDKTCKTFS